MKKHKLKVGLLINSKKIPAWAYRMIELIKESEYAEIVVLIQNAEEPSPNNFKKYWQKKSYFLYNLYRNLDRKIFKISPDAFTRKDIRKVTDAPLIEVKPRETKFCDWIEGNNLEYIKSHEPDILIRLGFRILKGEILNLPTYGIWSFHHGDNSVNRGGPPGFWEVMNKEKQTGVVLQILSNKLDAGLILERSFSLTDKVSVNRNINRMYWKALSFVPRNLKRLYEEGDNFLENKRMNNPVLGFYSHKLYRPPSNGPMVQLIIKTIYAEAKRRLINIIYIEQWGLLFKFNPDSEISTSLYQFKELRPPKDRIWADPHVIYENDLYYIFIEEMTFSENRGWISVIEMDHQGNYKTPQRVLEKETHLSYPFIFKDKGEIYMLPETKKTRTVEIYKATKFPFEWSLVQVIMQDVIAVDPTVIKFDEKYWLFVNKVENQGASAHDELHLYYSDDLLSNKWNAHPQNPVISDVKRARPAGRPFMHKNNLFRPSQNCSYSYGYGITINKIEILNETEYSEVPVDFITPKWSEKYKGIHTLDWNGKLTVADGLKRIRRF